MAITLKELNNILKEKIPKTMFHVKGEVSRPKLYPSALYFTLKDDTITISCKMWRNKLNDDINRLVCKIDEGYGYVGLYRFACFGINKKILLN